MKRLKKTGILFCVFLLIATGLAAGCGRHRQENTGYFLFYLNKQREKIVSKSYDPESTDTKDLIEEFITRMSEDSDDVDYQKIFPDNVKIERYEYTDHQLYLYFNKAYGDMPTTEEVLCRGAVVHNMMQIHDIDGVSIYVNNLPLTDANGNEVGILTNDSFVENPGEKINNIQEANLTLYFASTTGDGLVRETQHVYYSSNTSLEKLIMERLLDGPKSSNARSAIPDTTQLVSVSVMDGACLVNLDEGFLNQNFEIKEDVIIYSIVDSLTELDTINTVQIAVNGKTDITYRDKMSLGEYYKRDLDLVTEDGDEVEVVQKQEKEGLLDSGE